VLIDLIQSLIAFRTNLSVNTPSLVMCSLDPIQSLIAFRTNLQKKNRTVGPSKELKTLSLFGHVLTDPIQTLIAIRTNK
jgi:hypothetical protein